MTVLSAQSIIEQQLVNPCCGKEIFEGVSYGLGPAGYDIRLAEDIVMTATGKVYLCSAIERFRMPADIIGHVTDKSTWARRGLMVQNTVIEPGWHGYLTLELTYVGVWGTEPPILALKAGTGIAQVVFQWLDKPTDRPYDGKYQNQKQGAQAALDEGTKIPHDSVPFQMRHPY
jgi:dCTP deaminase